MRDEIKNICGNDECFIMNTDESSSSGSHRVAVNIDGTTYYFDSFGLGPIEEIKPYCKEPRFYNPFEFKKSNEVIWDSVGNVGNERHFNRRSIVLNNKLEHKVAKSGDTMKDDLKLTFIPDSSNLSLSPVFDVMDRNHSMQLILGYIHNQIYHANGASVSLIGQHGFEFECSENRTTTFDHDIQLNDKQKHISGLIDPVSRSGAVTKQYNDSKLALTGTSTLARY